MVDYLAKKYKASLHKFCQTIHLHRSAYYHKSCRDDSGIEVKLNKLAAEFSTHDFDWYYQKKIRSEGLMWNHKYVLLIYRNLGLGLPGNTKNVCSELSYLMEIFNFDLPSDGEVFIFISKTNQVLN